MQINVIYHINKLKDKNHVIISMDAEKDFDKIQRSFMIKKKKKNNLQKIRNKGTKLNIIRAMYGFPNGSTGKESACNAGDLGSIPGLGRSPGEGKDYPLQYSSLENSMDCIVLGSSPSRIQGYPQDDGIGERIAKQREQRLDLPWLTQKANKVPGTELALFMETTGALSVE